MRMILGLGHGLRHGHGHGLGLGHGLGHGLGLGQGQHFQIFWPNVRPTFVDFRPTFFDFFSTFFFDLTIKDLTQTGYGKV